MLLILRIIKSLQRKMSTSNIRVDLGNVRTVYKSPQQCFLEEHLPSRDPFVVFDNWYNAAKKPVGDRNIAIEEEINAMVLSTCSRKYKVSSRVVLLKHYGHEGFTFFTYYTSRKGTDLSENPNASLLFYWPWMHSQVRIEGTVQKTSAIVSEEYWKKRPVKSQASAFCSDQSKPVRSRKVMEEAKEELFKRLEGSEIPKPDNWGGYVLVPNCFEFWQGQTDRFHDRIVFSKDKESMDADAMFEGEDGWFFQRLFP